MSGPRFILADTETTGAGPKDKIVELAWVELDEDMQVLDRVHSLIDPQMRISYGASGVHGIVNSQLEDQPTIEEFFSIVRPNALDGDVILIAHHVQFDRRFIEPYAPNIVADLCTLRMSKRAWPELGEYENYKLPTLMYALDLTRGVSHSAAGDVETTLDLLRKLAEKLGMSLMQMVVASALPVFVEYLTFGKHKAPAGEPPTRLRSVDKGYLRWIVGNTSDSDLVWSAKEILEGR